MTGIVSLVLDCLILALLGASIFYSVRLSLRLKTFRDSREELANLLEDLSNNITQAEQAILGMKETARSAGGDLQDRIGKARTLCDELQFISEAGNNLASRLERLAARGPGDHPAQQPVSAPRETPGETPRALQTGRPSAQAPASASGPSFAIRDRDFDRGEQDVKIENPFSEDEDDEAGPLAGLHSKAEKDLYEALRRNRGRKGGGAR